MKKFENLIAFIEKFPTEMSCRKYLEHRLWANCPRCPYCESPTKVYRFKNGKHFKCAACSRQFQITTGTIYEKSNIPLKKWFLATYLISSQKKGISSVQLSKALEITQKSAWFLSHKIRLMILSKESKGNLVGVIECDETYIGGKMKGGKRGRGSENKIPVFGMLQRQGDLKITPVEDTKRKTLEPIIINSVIKGSHIMTDEWWAYRKLSRYYKHDTVNHGSKEYVNGDVHVNSLEGAWSLLKRSIRGIFHKVSKQHLAKYCAEFQYKYNTRNDEESFRFDKLLNKVWMVISYRDIVPSL